MAVCRDNRVVVVVKVYRKQQSPLTRFLHQIGANLIDAQALGAIPLTPRQHATAASLLTDPSAVLEPPLPQRNTTASLVASSVACSQLLSCADDATLRAKVYAAMGASPAANEALVQQLVDLRRATASVLGARSYTASQTEGFSLAGRPEAAEAFLLQLLDALQPRAQREVDELAAVKARLTGEGGIQPWDRQYLVALQRVRVCGWLRNCCVLPTVMCAVMAGCVGTVWLRLHAL